MDRHTKLLQAFLQRPDEYYSMIDCLLMITRNESVTVITTTNKAVKITDRKVKNKSKST
jgi:hypothetical protein